VYLPGAGVPGASISQACGNGMGWNRLGSSSLGFTTFLMLLLFVLFWQFGYQHHHR
jgi:hypothetical protein